MEMLDRFYASLPFSLTHNAAAGDCGNSKDLQSAASMNRLLQGDVGSGKTHVAMAAMITVCENGFRPPDAPTKSWQGKTL